MNKFSQIPYDRVVMEIRLLLQNKRLSVAERLDAAENIHDYIEPLIDKLQDDVDDEIARVAGGLNE